MLPASENLIKIVSSSWIVSVTSVSASNIEHRSKKNCECFCSSFSRLNLEHIILIVLREDELCTIIDFHITQRYDYNVSLWKMYTRCWCDSLLAHCLIWANNQVLISSWLLSVPSWRESASIVKRENNFVDKKKSWHLCQSSDKLFFS